MSRNIVFEGWLTKSPPNKRIWRTKWRRRWFALRQSGELPGQYLLDYYADRNCRRLKGTINLDLCEQVDAGLHMERAGNGNLDQKLRGSVFTIQTQSRTYHLEAECEDEMEKWVDAICRVCGLRPTEDNTVVIGTYQSNVTTGDVSATNEHYECADATGPYIPISECITGVRAQDQQRAFTFDSVSPQKTTCDKATETRRQHVYSIQPQIRVTTADFSENESNISDEDCKSLNASQSNIPDWSVTKSFTKLAISPNSNECSDVAPPVPPRPPKTFARHRDIVQKDSFHGPKIQEPVESVQESIANYTGTGTPWLRVPRRMSHSAAPHSPGRHFTLPPNNMRYTDDEEENLSGHHSMQYCNLPSLPPAVDRALKPRYSSHSIGHINSNFTTGNYSVFPGDDIRQDTLQYLDLDLHTSPPPSKNSRTGKVVILHGKSMSAVEPETIYKTVDFLKTEAFNSTRQDAEASRNFQH